MNNRKNEFTVTTRSGSVYVFPYSKADPCPKPDNRIKKLFVDKELGNEAFTYLLESGEEGSVHLEQILEYNDDPAYFAELLIYRLSVEAQQRIEKSALSRRQIARRLSTSVPQLYRLLDPSNSRKSVRQLIALLHVLDCDLNLAVKNRKEAT
ncbi:MAG: hypothetical protein OXN26_16055 [Gammaproteobacteria bacterium]|nr:hypothetical protein [Gammaproteobacteria bacterium]